ncbi:MAG: transposase, partial [Acidobacteria bacterium]|nr:transposase [Acidobacteriota bacterium]
LGVDEKSFRKGHRYFTIVNDLDRSRVLYVVKGRKQEDFDTFWQTLTDHESAAERFMSKDG